MSRFRHSFITLLFVIMLLSSCGGGDPNVEVGYQPPFIPIRVAVNRWGDVSVESSYQLSTPIGTFDLTMGYSIAAIRRDADYPVLVIRVDDEVTVYELSPDNSFEVKFDNGNQYYREVNLVRDRDGDIILELESVEIVSASSSGEVGTSPGSTNTLPGNPPDSEQKPGSSTYSDWCPGAFATRLAVGSRAKVVAVPRLVVHEEPGEGTPTVYGHSLSNGRTVTILDGPICDGGMLWWYAESGVITLTNGDQHNVVGWMAEESGDEWLLEPLR
jgi:hypothetical protein